MDESLTDREFRKYQQRISTLQKQEVQKQRRQKADLERIERQRKKENDMCAFHTSQASWLGHVQDAPVFKPTSEQFKDPLAYIQSIQAEAAKYGICKIVPPVVPAIPAALVLNTEGKPFKFSARQQLITESKGDTFESFKFYQSDRKYTVADYERYADDFMRKRFGCSGVLPPRLVEAEYWRALQEDSTSLVEYGNDVEGSAFCTVDVNDPLAATPWNLQVLPKDTLSTLRLLRGEVPGVTSPMLYIGMLFATFAWHVEDHYLYSINYQHLGASKTWYGVPAGGADAFEEVALRIVYKQAIAAEMSTGKSLEQAEKMAYLTLLAKTTMFSPKLLLDNGIPVYRTVQNPGEFVVTFPRAYHSGFSNGFCIGEAVNFATGDWFPYGADASARYRRLGRAAILPHQQLLCLEAMALKDGGSASAERERGMVSSADVMVQESFVRFMREQHVLRSTLQARGASCQLMPEISSSAPCGECREMCYLAMTVDDACHQPLCLACAAARPSNSGTCTILVRGTWGALERMARDFEAKQHFGAGSGLTTSLGVDGLTEEVRHPQSSRQPGSLGADFQWQDLGEPGTSRLDGNWQPEQGDIAGLAAQLSTLQDALDERPPVPQNGQPSPQPAPAQAEEIRECVECGRPVPEARVGDDAQDCFCSSACATFAAARGQVQFRPGRQDTEEPTSSAAVPDQARPTDEADQAGSSINDGECRSSKRRKHTQGALLAPKPPINAHAAPMLCVDEREVNVGTETAPLMVKRRVFAPDGKPDERYLLATDVVKGSGFPANTSASNIVDRWFREADAKAHFCACLRLPSLRAFCKGINCGAGGMYVVGAEDVVLIGWVLEAALRPRLATFVSGVWPHLVDPMANLPSLLAMEAAAVNNATLPASVAQPLATFASERSDSGPAAPSGAPPSPQVGMAETEAAPATLSAWAVSPVEVWNVLMQQHHLLTRDQAGLVVTMIGQLKASCIPEETM